MLEARQYPPPTCCRPQVSHQPVALRTMGHRSTRAIPASNGWKEVLSSSSGLLYQVGRGRTPCNDHNPKCPKLLLEEHRVPLWITSGIDFRQRQAVRGHQISRLVPRHGDPTELYFSRAPSSKWSGRSHKQSHPPWTKSTTGPS